jgi:CheY-like chemotaxis protein
MYPYIILLVEDDEDDQRFFNLCLTRLKREVMCIVANDGIEAIEKLASMETLPNVIFLDINMPRMDGFECLRRIRESDNLKQLPIVMFSTAHKDFAEKKSLELGANRFIQKPTSLGEFCNVIREMLDYFK